MTASKLATISRIASPFIASILMTWAVTTYLYPNVTTMAWTMVSVSMLPGKGQEVPGLVALVSHEEAIMQ
jgi:hypothetical protein